MAAKKKGLSFKDAMEAAADGYVRHPEMSPGWTIGALPNIPGELWSLNPHTGSEYAYTASAADRAREDWYTVKYRIDRESLDAAAAADAAADKDA